MISFHITTLGAFGGELLADRDGYVHLTTAAALVAHSCEPGCVDVDCDECMSADEAAEMAACNREELAIAEAALAEWQTSQ